MPLLRHHICELYLVRPNYLNDNNSVQDSQGDHFVECPDARLIKQRDHNSSLEARSAASRQSQNQISEANVIRHEGHSLRCHLPLLLHMLQVLVLLGRLLPAQLHVSRGQFDAQSYRSWNGLHLLVDSCNRLFLAN